MSEVLFHEICQACFGNSRKVIVKYMKIVFVESRNAMVGVESFVAGASHGNESTYGEAILESCAEYEMLCISKAHLLFSAG